jgi:VWFA-related protein
MKARIVSPVEVPMPQHAMASVVGVALIGVLAGMPGPVSTASLPGAMQQKPRTVYASVTDKNGAALTDLQPADFEVKEGGKVCDIVSAEEAKIPLRVALLVADQGTGAFQLGTARFMQKLLGHAEFALYSVVLQSEKIVDFSHDGRELSAGVSRLGPRGRQIGAQLMEAIQEAAKEVKHEDRRPAIVVMRLGAEAATPITGDDVRNDLRRSGATLYVVSAAGAQASAPSQARGTDAVSVQQGQMRDSELAEGAFNLAQVLGDGAKESGGRHDQVIATTHAKALEQVAEELLHQYEIRYTLPDGAKPSDRISVTTKRKGVTMHAPSRIGS